MSEHIARKRFGQNFLRDESVIRAIVNAVRPQSGDTVIEIGPGLGALTEPLSGCLKTLHVIEIDRDIVRRLRTLPYADRLLIHEGDVLRFDFSSIPGRKKIVGNLPYNISTPLLFRLTSYLDEIEEAHFMLQKEVVERICAVPGNKNYGRLGIVLGCFFATEKIIDVPPEAFSPVPRVDSAVIRMIPEPGRRGRVSDPVFFDRLLRAAFAGRRKTLRNNLKSMVGDDELRALGMDPGDRAENIAPETFIRLADFLGEKSENRR